jgi:hypothetical protein
MVQPQFMEDFSPFRLGRVGVERVLFSNNPAPILCYTQDEEVPARWDIDLYRCVIWALGAAINTSRSGKMAVTQKLEQQVLNMVNDAAVGAANSDDRYHEAIPSFYSGTGFSFNTQQPRFVYPTATFNAGSLSL